MVLEQVLIAYVRAGESVRHNISSVQFSRSVVSDSATPWTMTMLLLLALDVAAL